MHVIKDWVTPLTNRIQLLKQMISRELLTEQKSFWKENMRKMSRLKS